MTYPRPSGNQSHVQQLRTHRQDDCKCIRQEPPATTRSGVLSSIGSRFFAFRTGLGMFADYLKEGGKRLGTCGD